MVSANGFSKDRVLQDFGNRLRRVRRTRNLRQLDVESLGLSYKYYQRLEAGQSNPTLLTLHRLAAAFEIPLSELFCSDRQHDTSVS